MTKTEEVRCPRCDGKGTVRVEGIDGSVSSTAFRSEEAKCGKCLGHGQFLRETTTRMLTMDGKLME